MNGSFHRKMARLLEGIRTADAAGANAVDFEEFVFSVW
jgi:hypothetical protein